MIEAPPEHLEVVLIEQAYFAQLTLRSVQFAQQKRCHYIDGRERFGRLPGVEVEQHALGGRQVATRTIGEAENDMEEALQELAQVGIARGQDAQCFTCQRRGAQGFVLRQSIQGTEEGEDALRFHPGSSRALLFPHMLLHMLERPLSMFWRVRS